MAETLGTAVVVCRCAESAVAKVSGIELEAAARRFARVSAFAEIDSLCHDGRAALSGLLASGGIDRLVVAACARPELEAGMSAALRSAGLAPNMFVVADLLGQCRALDGAASRKAAGVLSRAIARSEHLRPQMFEMLPVERRVLVLGSGEAGLAAAREISALGLEVVLVGAGEAAAEGKVEVLGAARLVAFRGAAGRFEVELIQGGCELRRRVGAVVVALEPEVRAGFDLYGLRPTPAVVSLTELERLLADPPALASRLSGLGLAAVALLAGLKGEGEATPWLTERVLRAALALRGLGLPVYVLARHLRVAARGLEALYQECRRTGTIFFRFTESFPRVSQEAADGRAEVAVIDEVLTQAVDLPPSLVVVGEIRLPAPGLAEVGRLLRLSAEAEGYLQTGNVHRWPVLTNRAGVFVVGGARRAVGSEAVLTEVSAAVAGVAGLLLPGEIAAPSGKVSIHRGRCTACLTCYRLCPHGAIRVTSRAEVEPTACQGCGICAAECPMDAIQIAGASDEGIAAELAATPSVDSGAPRLVAFCCRRARQAVAAAGQLGEPLPLGLELIEVPCAGKVELGQILDALYGGAGGVLVVACHEGNCRAEHGNTYARWRVEEAGRLLAEAGLEEARVGFGAVAPNMGREFLRLARSFEEAVAALGPSPLGSRQAGRGES